MYHKGLDFSQDVIDSAQWPLLEAGRLIETEWGHSSPHKEHDSETQLGHQPPPGEIHVERPDNVSGFIALGEAVCTARKRELIFLKRSLIEILQTIFSIITEDLICDIIYLWTLVTSLCVVTMKNHFHQLNSKLHVESDSRQETEIKQKP